MTSRLPALARLYHLAPRDVWALTLEQFLMFCEDFDAYVAAMTNR